MERYCTICQRLVDVSQMKLIHEKHGKAIYLDDKNNVVRTVLSAKLSSWYQPAPEETKE